MGLHISKLEIRNYRNFGDLRIDPFPRNAVITGENATGKSNLLRAIRLVLDPSLPDSARFLEPTDFWDSNPTAFDRGVTVEVILEFQGHDDDPDAKSSLSDCHVSFDPLIARLAYRFKPAEAATQASKDAAAEGSDYSFKISDYDFEILGGLDDEVDIRSIRREIAMRVLPALRNAEQDLSSWRRNPLKDILSVLPIDPDRLESAAETASKAIDELRKDPSISKMELGLHKRLEEMAGPRLPVDPALGFASTQPSELTKSIRLYTDQQRVRDVTSASLGTANLLYLSLLIEAIEYQRSSQQFVTMILGVEEPEAHLHVTLQRRLFRYLLREDSGIILTTHSPHIVAVSPLPALIMLKDEGTAGSTAATTAHAGLTDNEIEDLERYLDVTRAEFLFARYVILVEGAAEQFILPALASLVDLDLDSYGIVVCSVDGTDFAPYHKLLGASGLGIPHSIITDGDVGPDPKGRREAGLKRAVALLSDDAEKARLVARIDTLTEALDNADPDVDTAELRQEIVDDLSLYAFFVGERTLEVDLCQAFGPEIVAAFQELTRNRPARKEVKEYVDLEREGKEDSGARSDFLERISAVGKGRFGQRLGSHIEKIERDVFLRELDIHDHAPDVLASSVPGCAHVFRALDAASQFVRAKGVAESWSRTESTE